MGRMHSKRFDIMPDKLFTIVAGVNGVGKSTYIAKLRKNPNMLGYIIDPDQLAIKYGNIIAGGREALKAIYNCIREGISFTEETTLSGKHVADTILKAKANGYTVNMIYISLNSAEESISRVADRVIKGGHYIPDDIIRRRFNTRLDALHRVLLLCDYAAFYDNTDDYKLIAEYSNKDIKLLVDDYPSWIAGLKA